MKSRVSHMSSLFCAVWFEEKGRFRGEFEAADVFPAEDSMIQVRSRGNASHFVERKSPSSASSGLFSTLERRSDKQKHSVAMTCFAHDHFCAFAAVLKPPRATKEVVYPSRSRRKQERLIVGVLPGVTRSVDI